MPHFVPVSERRGGERGGQREVRAASSGHSSPSPCFPGTAPRSRRPWVRGREQGRRPPRTQALSGPRCPVTRQDAQPLVGPRPPLRTVFGGPGSIRGGARAGPRHALRALACDLAGGDPACTHLAGSNAQLRTSPRAPGLHRRRTSPGGRARTPRPRSVRSGHSRCPGDTGTGSAIGFPEGNNGRRGRRWEAGLDLQFLQTPS